MRPSRNSSSKSRSGRSGRSRGPNGRRRRGRGRGENDEARAGSRAQLPTTGAKRRSYHEVQAAAGAPFEAPEHSE
eukprot:2400062-Pyramimonas_sp.AAC.1